MNTKKLLLCGVVGSPLFVFVFTVAGAVRPNYSPLRQNVSSLEVGEFGWIQSANFIVTGFLFLAFSLGLRRALEPLGATWQPSVIALVALGLIGAGLFTPQDNALLHDLSSAPVFFGLPIGCVAIWPPLPKTRQPWLGNVLFPYRGRDPDRIRLLHARFWRTSQLRQCRRPVAADFDTRRLDLDDAPRSQRTSFGN